MAPTEIQKSLDLHISNVTWFVYIKQCFLYENAQK